MAESVRVDVLPGIRRERVDLTGDPGTVHFVPDRQYQFLDALPDAALVIDSGRSIVGHNRRVQDLLHDNLLNLDINHVIRQPLFASALDRAMELQVVVEADVEFFGGASRNVRIYISPLNNLGHYLILLRDFTREQAVEKMRSDFVTNASHEMRTPLASIIGSIETLQGAAKNDAKARDQFLGTMLTQAQRMKRLIDDLLVLSRIELNEHVRPNAKVSFFDIARQAKGNLAEVAKATGVSVEVKSGERIEVAGDADELLQVAQNLLENAIKYGSAGKRIEINCYAHDGQGFLAVRDFGKGIAEIHLPRLTERFYRVSTQESRSRGGTGLGLAIVKHIVLRHRGKLAVSSKEGEGSVFAVSIPLAES